MEMEAGGQCQGNREGVSQISEIQKGSGKKGIPEKYKKPSVPEILEIGENGRKDPNPWPPAQRGTAKKREVRRINQMFSNAPSKVYTQKLGYNNGVELPTMDINNRFHQINNKTLRSFIKNAVGIH